MPKQTVALPSDLPQPRGAYSIALRAGDFIYVSGQTARNDALSPVGATIEDQTRRTIEKITSILQASGGSWFDVVKSTVHLSDFDNFARYDTIYSELVPPPRPTRTTVGSVLPPKILVEIDVVAYIPLTPPEQNNQRPVGRGRRR